MGSPTKKVWRQRDLRRTNAGKARKNLARLHGSTAPNLPLDKPNAHEQKAIAAKAAAAR